MNRSTNRNAGCDEKAHLFQDELVRRSFAAAKEYARLYEGWTSEALFFNERLRRVLELVAPVSSGKVLDIGCGPGILLSCMGGGQLELFGLDRSPEMVAEAKARTAGLSVNLAIGRIENLPFPDQSFDVIMALGVLEYLPGLKGSLTEIARIARPTGIIVVSMLNSVSLYRWWERSIYRGWRALRHLLRGRTTEPTLWLHSRKSLMKMMKACQLEPIEVVYYDLNVCVPPFDSKYPKQAAALNRWVRLHCGGELSQLAHTAFLLKAHKNLWPNR
jgi:SAM-dependent methyltransferase